MTSVDDQTMIINGFLFGVGLIIAIVIASVIYRFLVERQARRTLKVVDEVPNVIWQGGRHMLVEGWEESGYSAEEIRYLLQETDASISPGCDSKRMVKAVLATAERKSWREAKSAKER